MLYMFLTPACCSMCIKPNHGCVVDGVHPILSFVIVFRRTLDEKQFLHSLILDTFVPCTWVLEFSSEHDQRKLWQVMLSTHIRAG
jgi:hypothetical protein